MSEETASTAVDNSDLLERLQGWARDDDKHWSQWRKNARQSYDFVASKQWSREEKAALDEGDRLPTTINRIGPMVNAVAGAEIIDRQQVQYIPRSVEDSGVNELLTKGAEWIRDQTAADREESDAFRDCLVCGLGFTETLMDYDDEPEGKVTISRIDPFEVVPDSTARKPNLTDGKRIRRRRTISKVEFEQSYPGATAEGDASSIAKVKRTRAGKLRETEAYADDQPNDDEVVLTEWQWFEFEVVYVAEDPSGALQELTPAEHTELDEAAAAVGVDLKAVKQRRKKYWRAVLCGDQVLEYEPLPDGEFRIKAITGERDQNSGTFFGIVEAMKDPQRFANLFFSMLHHTLRSNAKGGILAELGAFADQNQAEESWAKADSITWVTEGGMGKIQNKPAPNIPAQITQMMQFAVSGIRDASGINEELLGLATRQQAGVLEHQRKEAAYSILACYFDSLRFYRKEQGGLLLKYIQKYLPEGYLVRITGDDGVAKYAPLVKQPDTIKFDVIVDDAPSGPNQKEKTWALMGQLQGVLNDAGPEVWMALIEYSPFPEAVNQTVKKALQKQIDAASQPPPPEAAEMAKRASMAAIGRDEAAAGKDAAAARQTNAETDLGEAVAGMLAQTVG